MRLCRRSNPQTPLRIQQLNIHTPLRPTTTPPITPRQKPKFILRLPYHNPLPTPFQRARFALAFIAPVIGRAVIRNNPRAERSETGDDYRDGLLDGAPGADPGGGGDAAPGAVEDEADYGEEGY